LEMIDQGISQKKIKIDHPNIHYVIYMGKVYDLTNFLHPGG